MADSATITLTPVVAPSPAASGSHSPQVTAWDLAEKLLSYLGGNPEERASADIRRAIIDAYREMPGLHNWTNYIAVGRIFCNASYATGTIVYDHTGGANERQLTLTDGVWPTWADRGYVRIGLVNHYVDRRLSDTVLTLLESYNPGADIASGTAYELFQDSYQLPMDFTIGDRGLPEAHWGGMSYMGAADWLAMQHDASSTNGQPAWYTFTGDPKNAGRLALRIWPPVSSDQTLDFLYRRKAREIRTWDDNTGRASISDASDTITLSDGGVFRDRHVGSVIRLANSVSALPTGLEGSEPYEVERTIRRLVSTTIAVLDEAVDDTYASVCYRISDPLDIEVHSMYNALYASSLRMLMLSRNRKEFADATAAWRFALEVAKEADMRSGANSRVSLGAIWRQRLADMPLGEYES